MGIKQYEEQLKGVYGKYYCSGQCINYSQCKKGLVDDGLFFNCAKLGKHYGEGPYPRVLVIGKEPITENKVITRTATLGDADNPHYRRTLYTLATILEKKPDSDAINNLKQYEKLLDYFCLTNYFKCSFTEVVKENGERKAKTNSNIKTSKAMCDNCWRILIDEINALKPEIVVVQGRSYAGALWEEICSKECFGENQLLGDTYKQDYEELTKHTYKNGDPLYIVWAYHPTARGDYGWKKRLKNLQYIIEKLEEERNKH